MDLPHCTQFGFDAKRIQERLSLSGLTDQDHKLAGQLQQDVILPNFSAIMDNFITAIIDHPDTRTILHNSEMTKKIKKIITTFLLSLGSGFNSAVYFEHRLHVGLAHEAVGLPLSLYLCAYRTLTQAVIANFPPKIGDDRDNYAQLVEFLYKINALDMSLAIETYHNTQVRTLEESLDGMQRRTKQLKQQAITDALTGMVNHDYVFEALGRMLQRAQSKQLPLCIVMADLDYFKKVNDNHGHQAGDQVLSDVASRIKGALREFDVVGRYGGEEFLLLLQDTPLETARIIAERIRLRITDHPINLADLILHVSISSGIAMANADDDVQSLVKRADQALYKAKDAGRNKVCVG